MSRCTADLEFLQCDLCQTYFHKEIFCPHRRECKGPGSVELKKGEAEAIRHQIDLIEDSNQSSKTEKVICNRAALELHEQVEKSKLRTQLANSVAEEDDRRLKQVVNKNKLEDALAFLDS